MNDLILRFATKALQKFINLGPPITPSSRSVLPIAPKLPGIAFDPLQSLRSNHVSVLPNGCILVSPGDFVFPVTTFCMKAAASSPSSHKYQLATLTGRASNIIRALNARAVGVYPQSEIQTLSWAIQNAVHYEEMSGSSKKIVDAFLPEFKGKLSRNPLEILENRWTQFAKYFPAAPTFSESKEIILDHLGETGSFLRQISEIQEKVKRFGAEYETFAATVTTPGRSSKLGNDDSTPWSIIKEGVFARFVTEGHYGDPGVLQLRVSHNLGQTKIDVSSLVADPDSADIQPLSFGPVLAGIAVATNLPRAVGLALFAAAIATANYGILIEILKKPASRGDTTDEAKLREEASKLLSEKHDEMEKEARSEGVLDGAKQTKEGGNFGTRNYEQSGGAEARNRDFDRLPGKLLPTKEGVKVKETPEGRRYVSRDDTSDGDVPTIEIQQVSSTNPRVSDPRVKIRYRKDIQ